MKILIAEDVPVSVHILRNILERLGHSTVEARDGEEALSVLEEHPDVNCAFVDVGMPGLNGLELVGRMRADARWARLPVVFVTAAADPSTVRSAAALECIGYLLKPISAPGRVRDLVDRAAGEWPRVCDAPERVADRLNRTPAEVYGLFSGTAAALEDVIAEGVSRDALAAAVGEVAKVLGAQRVTRALEGDASTEACEWEARALLNACRDAAAPGSRRGVAS